MLKVPPPARGSGKKFSEKRRMRQDMIAGIAEQDALVREVGPGQFAHEVLESPLPVLVDFYGAYCLPCHDLEPTLDLIANENRECLKVVKIMMDENEDVARAYGVTGTPTMLMFRDGELVGRLLGNKPFELIVEEFGL